jgi:hypothetical protein
MDRDKAKGATGVEADKAGNDRKYFKAGCRYPVQRLKLVQLLEKHNCCWPHSGARNPINNATFNIDLIQHLRKLNCHRPNLQRPLPAVLSFEDKNQETEARMASGFQHR